MEQTKTQSYLDEKFEVTLTRFELMKIREWNKKRMEASMQALENMLMKSCKRSRWQQEYDFHSALCDHLNGIDPDEESKRKEHNESIQTQLDLMEQAMADMRKQYEETKRQIV